MKYVKIHYILCICKQAQQPQQQHVNVTVTSPEKLKQLYLAVEDISLNGEFQQLHLLVSDKIFNL